MTVIQNFRYVQTRFLQNPPFPSLFMFINSWPSSFVLRILTCETKLVSKYRKVQIPLKKKHV